MVADISILMYMNSTLDLKGKTEYKGFHSKLYLHYIDMKELSHSMLCHQYNTHIEFH